MMRLYTILFLLLVSTCLPAASLLTEESPVPCQYGLYAKKEGSAPITKFALFCQRCSGSNYLQDLIKLNLAIQHQAFGHKHFTPWYQLGPEQFFGDRRLYTFENTDDFLFLVIYRNPYDWARSLRKNPWHAALHVSKSDFSAFIRTPWELISIEKDRIIDRYTQANPLLERNPENGALFENVFQLRSAHVRNLLFIKERAKNVYYLQYEAVRDYPREVLDELSRLFSIEQKGPFQPITEHVGGIRGGKEYKPYRYPPISSDDLFYINSQLDEALEHVIGYRLYDNPETLESL